MYMNEIKRWSSCSQISLLNIYNSCFQTCCTCLLLRLNGLTLLIQKLCSGSTKALITLNHMPLLETCTFYLLSPTHFCYNAYTLNLHFRLIKPSFRNRVRTDSYIQGKHFLPICSMLLNLKNSIFGNH